MLSLFFPRVGFLVGDLDTKQFLPVALLPGFASGMHGTIATSWTTFLSPASIADPPWPVAESSFDFLILQDRPTRFGITCVDPPAGGNRTLKQFGLSD
jgi:hypothetical protein